MGPRTATIEEAKPSQPARLSNVEDIYPLSPMQQGMLFHFLYQPASEMYFIQLGCHIEGGLDVPAFRRAWETVISRHTILRASFLWEGLKEPLQVVRKRVQLKWREEDWRHMTEAERRIQWRESTQQDRKLPFDLNQAPLMRWALMRTGEQSYYFRWSYSHLLLDGWCRQTVMREVFTLYEAYRKGWELELESPRPYRDYISWLQQQGETAAETFWRAELKGFRAPTRFGVELERESIADGEPEYEKTMLQLSRPATEKLEELTRSLQLTQNAVVQGAWALLLSRYSGSLDVIFGATVAGRSAPVRGIESMVGLFINTLPVRVQLDREERVGAFLKRLQARQVDAREYEHSPLMKVQEWSEVPRGTRLFDQIVVFENFPIDVEMRDRVSSSMRIAEVENFDVNNFALTLVANPGPELLFICSFSRKQFNREIIDRMLRQLAAVLEKMAAAPDQRVSDISLLSEAERHQVVFEWNQTGWEQTPQCVHESFEEQAATLPEAAALECDGQLLTYEQLNQRANQLAHYLRALGVGPETMVGLCMDRTPEMVVGLFGILKAGAAYVPIDPAYPAERISFVLGDAQIAVLLTQRRLLDSLPTAWAQVITIDDEWTEIAKSPDSNPVNVAGEANLAYVIYTSGSTGQPKGVAVTHGGLRNYVNWAIQAYRIGQNSCSPAHSSMSFDLTVTSLYPALLTGARVVLLPQSAGMEQLAELVESRDDINPLKLTPSHLRMLNALLEQKKSTARGVQVAVIGGEALSYADLHVWREQGVSTSFVNEYGPTETVVGSVIYEVGPETGRADVPIGRPIANTSVYVLDEYLDPVPPGVAGELYIGGAGVARGYLNRADLTAERFLPDAISGRTGERLYRTGDRALWRSDGILEYAGRFDDQVKIRGYRIELGEIESVLRDHRSIQQARVVVREDTPENRRLVAYVVKAAGAAAVNPTELRRLLEQRLPEYMVPAAILELEELPLTPNGKLDYKALPAPEQARTVNVCRLPRSVEEEILSGIFSEVLKVDQPGLDENFFELGGHSLLATQVISQIRSALEVELPLRVLFDAPTVAQLAEQVRAARGTQKLAPQIVPVERGVDLPLSYAQQRLWFIDQLEPGGITFNRPFGLRLTGELDRVALQRSLDAMVKRHEVLRTTFPMRNGGPVQEIAVEQKLQIKEIDLRAVAQEQRDGEVSSRIAWEISQPFDLGRGPLLRACLMQLAEQEHVLLVTTHHVIGDMWSTGIIIREFGRLYESYLSGKDPELPELKVQYADFAVWQRNWLQGEVLEQKVGYWRKQLQGLPILDLPADRPRPPVMGHDGANARFAFPPEVVEKIKALSRREGVTLFMTMMAAFKVMLTKYSGQNDLAIGTVIANRNRKEIEGLIGFFSNSLVLRTAVKPDATFRSLLASVRQTTLEAYDHQDVPFEKLVEELQPVRDLARTPLFQVMMILEHMQMEELRMVGLSFKEFAFPTSVAQFDLTLQLTEWSGGIYGSFLYATELYSAERMERMAGHLRNVVDRVLAHPETQVSAVSLLSEAEERQIIVDWNSTVEDYPQRSVQELFDEQAERTPSAVAVEFENSQFTYAELQQRVHQMAQFLAGMDLGREARVGICMERSVDMLVSMMGTLKAGAAYVPLGAEDASERRAGVIDDAGLSLILTDGKTRPLLAENNRTIVEVDRHWDEIAKPGHNRPVAGIDPQNLAYVIYTSGSTGKPKGVGVSHGALTNFLFSMLRRPGIAKSDRLLAVTPISFDIAGLEMYLPLMAGARVRILPRDVCVAGDRLAREVEDATIMQATPATWQMLLEAGWMPHPGLKILCGGEALPETVAKKLLAKGNSLWNMYGPTETTIWSLIRQFTDAGEQISIGRPIANTRVYVLDREMRPVPVGVDGELYIGGTGLARGYWKRPELTAERFVPDSFSTTPGERLYRTGDLVRWRDSGDLEFLGRTDYQVKVRGYRIELGELEAALSRCEGVAQAVAIVREDRPGEKRLIGYVVRSGATPVLDLAHVRNTLKRWLPEYMLPAALVELEQLPLTPNGKVDRKALPIPGAQPRTPDLAKPKSEEEEILCGIFATLLHLETVAVDANFFELGGHSLLATQIISRIRSVFAVELPVRALFESPTVAEITVRVREAQGRDATAAPPLVSVAREGDLPLSYAQQRLWFLHQMDPQSPAYNIPFALRLTGKLDREALRSSVHALVQRHEVLRTSFPSDRGKPIQRIDAELKLEIEQTDLRTLTPAQREGVVRELMQEQANRPFDLTHGPLLRVALVQTGDEEHALLVTLHHIISDAWSLGIVVREFCAFYTALVKGEKPDLPELKVQYADFALWQRDWLQGALLERHLAYWKKELTGADRLDLPTDFDRAVAASDRAGQEIFSLGPELTRSLTGLSQREGVTVFIVLLAAYQLILARYTGKQDIVVGTDIANRNLMETESLIGFFVNQLVLRTNLSGGPSFRELLRRVREVVLGAYEHQDLPFEKLVEAMTPGRDADSTPLFQVKLVLQNVPQEEMSLPDLVAEGMDTQEAAPKFDILMTMAETKTGLRGITRYNAGLFKPATIRSFQHFFQAALTLIAENQENLDLPQEKFLSLLEQRVHSIVEQSASAPNLTIGKRKRRGLSAPA